MCSIGISCRGCQTVLPMPIRTIPFGGDAGEAQPVWVRGENVYHLYNYILVNGEGRVIRKLPETAPGIDLDFGDGGNLKVWDNETGGAILCYTDDAGQYAYVTKAASMETMQINFLSLSENVAWTKDS